MDDLDRFQENDSTDKEVYKSFQGYKGAIAKVYGAYTLTGNEGPAGKGDLTGLDEGSVADFLRGFYNVQVLPTDEALCIWGDEGIPGLNFINFTSTNPFLNGLYNRCIMQIMYANEFLKNADDATIQGKGFSAEEMAQIKLFREEARFLRAFQYWVLMDLFANPPFIDEQSVLGELPKQIKRPALFAYIEKELNELKEGLVDAQQNEYGRADKAAANALLARLYLNAEVYIKEPRYTDAITACNRILAGGYSLKESYETLFLSDNHLDNKEVILAIPYDGVKAKNYGGTTFLINCSYNAKVLENNPWLNFGLTDNAGWGGMRVTKNVIEKFKEGDKRFLFVGDHPDIDNVSDFSQGMTTYKYRNITSKGIVGEDSKFASNDFPLFRLAEIYLIYLEAMKRGGQGGSQADALNYMNRLQERAFGSNEKNYGSYNDIGLEDLIDERARELYWEGHRRTDLIRFKMFTSPRYLWQWKGGVKEGRAVSNHYNIFPIPSSDVMANRELKQNPSY